MRPWSHWAYCLGFPFLFAIAATAAGSSAPPLHVDGRHLKDPAGNIVLLRGVNHHGFLDIPDGAWDLPGAPLYSGMGNWDPSVVKATLDSYRLSGFNVVRFHTVVDWWKTDPKTHRDPYRSVTYPKSYRRMMEDVVGWAGERGLYVIFDFFALKNVNGVQSGQESLPWPPWGRYPAVVSSRKEFVSIWRSVAQTLGKHPNVLFELYNEPHGDAAAEKEWFRFVPEALKAIRKHSACPVIVQWDYMCWVNLDFPPPEHAASTLAWVSKYPQKDAQVIIGVHLYRNSGEGHGSVHRSRGGKTALWEKSDLEMGFRLAGLTQVLEERQKPILVTEVGAYLKGPAEEPDREIRFLRNALEILNGWGVGYVGWAWQSDKQIDHGMLGPDGPNEAGRVFLESLKQHSISEGR